MKRFHVHVSVDDLQANVRFYSTVFGQDPTILQPDYAKWMVDDPRVNFAISKRGARPGLDHLGLQVESDEALAALRQQVAGAEIAAQDQSAAQCCYARSNKYWISDPQGIAWETFHTLSSVPVFGEDHKPQDRSASPCCTPAAVTVSQPAKSGACCA